MDTDGKFYLGRIFDLKEGEVTEESLLYDPDDLTTHAVVVGMTGSGKTGLCIDLLEEAALNDIPAILIDPKGDMTNALLHFPELLPQDFQPWVNPDDARRDGKTVEEAAEGAANLWRKGLGKWGIEPDRIKKLQDSAHFAVYTPGSDAGIPVSILASLKAPPIPWEENRELLREKIADTVTALLGLVGMKDVDPVRSREHILLSNIFEHSWSQGHDLNLSELIMQTQTPPFSKLGVFEVNTFFPQNDRFELAMMLNNILAAPAFQTWVEGQPLDIASLLYGSDGRPRHSVFYIAHLGDAERMFFVTLLYSAIESWMRSQSGTNSLRAIVYFDEIFGYLPPISNPPSKEPILRMLKQARAFGVGQVLVTQNPVDVDYKALSNAGTWFIGKLQTDQDKQRLLDGLESAVEGGLDRSEYDRLISGIGKRVFLLKNVHESEPVLFNTRWAMNYLTGPLTRNQIPALNKMVGAGIGSAIISESGAPDLSESQTLESRPPTPSPLREVSESTGSATKPAVPARVAEYFLPNNLTLSQAFKSTDRSYPDDSKSKGLIYRPAVLAQSSIRILNRRYDLDIEWQRMALVTNPDRRGMVRWDDFQAAPIELRKLDDRPASQARFGTLESPLSDAKILSAMKKDFMDWAYRRSEVSVRVNEKLKVYGGPQMSESEFNNMCAKAAKKLEATEIEKVAEAYNKKIDRIEDRLEREERELREDQDELSQRKQEEWGTHAETVLSLFGKRRRSISSSMTKRRMTAKAKADVEESVEEIKQYNDQIEELEKELAEELNEIKERWEEIIVDVDEISVAPYKKDVLLDFFGVAWFPYHIVQVDSEDIELPGYIDD